MRCYVTYVLLLTCAIASLTQAKGGADIVFILDGSGSITNSSFRNYLLQFVKDVVAPMNLGTDTDENQVAVVQFGNVGRIDVPLTGDRSDFENAVNKIKYMDENTNTSGGILEALEVFRNSSRFGNVARIGILLTDGPCTWDCHRLSAVAEAARTGGNIFLAIGIGDDIDKSELRTISTDESKDFFERDFSRLLRGDNVRQIRERIEEITENQQNIHDAVMTGADVVFILDSSESVTESSFKEHVLPFVHDVIERLSLGATKYQASIISYGTHANVISRIRTEYDLNDVSNMANTIPFRNDATNTPDALWAFRTTVTSRDWKTTSRAHLPTVGVLITDGRTTVDPQRIVPEAMKIHNEGLNMIVLAVGEDGDVEEDMMRVTASEPHSENLMRYMDFSELSSMSAAANKLLERITSFVTVEQEPTTEEPHEPGTFEQWACDFEDDNAPICDMEQISHDDFDWTRRRGATPSFDTGPYRASSGDFYIFIEASNREENDFAAIYMPKLQSSGQHCLTFDYNMYGFHIADLVVAVRSDDGRELTKWSDSRDKKNAQWLTHKLDIDLEQNDQIAFVGTRGEAFSGDIALDNIHLSRGNCDAMPRMTS